MVEKWAARNPMRFSRGKCQVLPLRGDNPPTPVQAGAGQLEGSSAQEGPGGSAGQFLRAAQWWDETQRTQVQRREAFIRY